MKVKCIQNKSESYYQGEKRIVEHSLDIGRLYTVYTMTADSEGINYYLHEDCDSVHHYCSSLFEVIDKSISRYWICNYVRDRGYLKPHTIWSFPEWANSSVFFYHLFERDDDSFSIYLNYKEMMDLEFEDEAVTINPSILDDEWIMCPDCIDAWECTNVMNALIVCPYCNNKMNNPRYAKYES